ncbi:hypothetical protein GCM10027406_18560 [Leifsonia lichenia]
MSVPAVSGPVPLTPGAPQKTIGELLTQWADLTDAAIAATGVTDGWFRGAVLDNKPWDPAAEEVALSPCGTVGSKTAHQVDADVAHAAFEADPHPIADKLTAYWESQGFTVTRTVDSITRSGWMGISIRAVRSDGVYYGLTATSDQVSIGVKSECSTDPSIDTWAEERVRERLNSLFPTPSTPTPAAGADAPPMGADDWFSWM